MPFNFFADIPNLAIGFYEDTTHYPEFYQVNYRASTTINTSYSVDLARGITVIWPEHVFTDRVLMIGYEGFPAETSETIDVVGYPPTIQSKRLSVSTIPVLVGGSYELTPTVIFSNSQSGVTARGVAVLQSNTIVAVTVTEKGSGYLTPPTISFVRNINDTFSGDADDIVLTEAYLENVYIDIGNRAKYFRIKLPVEYDPPAASNFIPVVSAGIYDVLPDGILFSPPDMPNGVQAEADINYQNGEVTGMTITKPGRGYSEVPQFIVVRNANDLGDQFGYRLGVDALFPSNPGVYDITPTVVFSTPSNPGGIQITGVVVMSGQQVAEIQITNRGRGYTAIPNVTVVRDQADPQTTNAVVTIAGDQMDLLSTEAQFDSIFVTKPVYTIHNHITFSEQTVSPTSPYASQLQKVEGTLFSTWIWWPNVKYASNYTLNRDNNELLSGESLKQLPYEDVNQQGASYSITANYGITLSNETELTTTLTFKGEPPHIGQEESPFASYNISFKIDDFGPGDALSYFWNNYGTLRCPNSKRDTVNVIPGVNSPYTHKVGDSKDEFNTIQKYKVFYEAKAYLPAHFIPVKETKTIALNRLYKCDTLELVTIEKDINTAVRTETLTSVTIDPNVAPSWDITTDLVTHASTKIVFYEFEVKQQSFIIKTKTVDGKWYMFWPAVTGNKGYDLYYQIDEEDPVQITLPDRFTQYYRDVVVLTPIVNTNPDVFPPNNELNWNSVAYATAYDVYRRQLGGEELWEKIAIVTSAEHPYDPNYSQPTDYVDEGIDPTLEYEYSVEAARDPINITGHTGTYFVKTRVDPTDIFSDYPEGVEVYWNGIDLPGVKYVVERQFMEFQIGDGAYSDIQIAQAFVQPGDGNDDGVVDEQNYTPGDNPDPRETSYWIPATGTATNFPPRVNPINCYPFLDTAFPNEIRSVKNLVYRVIAHIPVNPNNVDILANSVAGLKNLFADEAIQDGHIYNSNTTHTVRYPNITTADKLHLWARVKLEGDEAFDQKEVEDEGITGEEALIYYGVNEKLDVGGEGGLQFNGYNHRYSPLVVNYVFMNETRTPEFTDTTDYSQPSVLKYNLQLGPYEVNNTEADGPSKKTIIHSYVSERVFTLPWLNSNYSYTFQYQDKQGDNSFSGWKDLVVGDMVVDYVGHTLTDTTDRFFPYTIRYAVRGRAKSNDVLTL